jgi:protocatechuate 3,4-dioxygenase beta subunit
MDHATDLAPPPGTNDGTEGDADHDHLFLPVIELRPLTRRRALGLIGGGLGAALLAACGNDSATGSPTTAGQPVTTAASGSAAGTTSATTVAPVPSTAAGATTAATTTAAPSTAAPSTAKPAAAIDWLTPPTETGGPFPADGSNGNGAGGSANVLNKPAVFRTDMTTDLDGTNHQAGLPLVLKVKVGKKADRSAYAGAAVYVWHCSVTGNYSAYSGGMNGGNFADRSYFRAVGVADANGDVTFTTVLPGRYQGRATHIHFAVFTDESLATRVLTSQFAFDDATVDALYQADGAYSASLRNPTYNARDNVFRDGTSNQLLAVTRTSAVEAAIAVLV